MERLACNQCKGIICVDFEDNERIIGNPKEGFRFIMFPESVKDCSRRVDETQGLRETRNIFDQIPP